jgi:hypothetical protein
MQAKRKISSIAFRVLAILAAFVMSPLLTVQAAATTPPTISVIGVNPGEQVQVMIYNLPADTNFTVTESAVGHQGVGPVIAHFNSLDGGTRSYWFEILTDVRTNDHVEIRIDNGAGISAYTSFQNTETVSSTSTTTTTTATTATTAATAASTIAGYSPTMGMIHVLHVQKGGIVIAELQGMPLDTQFTVTIGTAGSQGFDGYKVGNLSSGERSDHIGTFEIPIDLATERGLDLRIEAPGYLYLVTFSNTSF